MNDLKTFEHCFACGRPLYTEDDIYEAYGEPLCDECYDRVCYEQHITDEENGLYDE